MTTDLTESGLTALARLAAAGTPVALAGGQVLFEQGASGDSMYLLVSGRLRVYVEAGGRQVGVGEIVAGETVGEMALLVGEPRSATVVAARDCRLVRITAAAFESVARADEGALLALTRELVHRLQHANRGPAHRAIPATIAVTAGATAELGVFTQALAAALADHGEASLVTAQDAAGRSEVELAGWLDRLESHHRFVLYQADGAAAWRERCLRQADLVLVLGPPSAPLSRPSRSRCELVLIEGDSVDYDAGVAFDATHRVRLDRPGDLGRLARNIAGETVGLVLGGGGARGFAHIGVLRALRELEIPVDAVGGASMGSILAGLVALELETEAIVELSRRWLVQADLLGEKQLPLVSAVNPRRFDRSLAALFGERLIEDLPLRFFCVSANLTQAELVVHERGSLREAIRASTALPGILPPAVRGGDLLVDGGVLDNLPGEVMRSLVGGRVIASDVSPRRDLGVDPKLTSIPGNRQLVLHAGHPAHVPGMLQILVRTLMLGSLHSTHRVQAEADVYLHPPTDQVGIFDFDQLDQLVETGYRHSLPVLAEWKERVLAR